MPDHLQQAITLIKLGKKQEAQQLLLKILTDEPNNEQAWLWLSGVVSEDKRRYCIEKALSINPNNQQAKQALIKLTQLESKPSVIPSPPTPPPPAKPSSTSGPTVQPLPIKPTTLTSPPTPPMPITVPSVILQSPSDVNLDKSIPEFWINPERGVLYITVLLENELISATINPGQAKQVQTNLQRGHLPLEMLTNKKVVPLIAITEVSQTMSSVRVHYTETNLAKSTPLECADDAMAEAILNALQERLGSGFERSSTPMSIAIITIFALISVMVILGATTFCYFGAAEAASGELTPTGSARTRGIIALLGLLGPNGVACVGGVLFVLALGVITYYLVKPPLVTKLLPKGATTKSTRKSRK